MSKYNPADGSNRLNSRVKMNGGGKFNAAPKRQRGGKFVKVDIRASNGETHSNAGVFTFGCVDKADGVPFFFVDGAVDSEMSGERIALLFARMVRHMCRQLEPIAPGITEALFRVCADEAENSFKGIDSWGDNA